MTEAIESNLHGQARDRRRAADGAVFRGTLADKNNANQRLENAGWRSACAALAAASARASIDCLNGVQSRVGRKWNGDSRLENDRQGSACSGACANPAHQRCLTKRLANLDYAPATRGETRARQFAEEPDNDRHCASLFSMVKGCRLCLTSWDQVRVTEAVTPDELIPEGGWFAGFA